MRSRSGPLIVGLGLNSRATRNDVLAAIDEGLASVGADREDVVAVATAEHRRWHPALTDLPLTLAFWPTEQFLTREVAEPAARLAAPDGEMLLSKRCTDRVCLAITTAISTGRNAQAPSHRSSLVDQPAQRGEIDVLLDRIGDPVES